MGYVCWQLPGIILALALHLVLVPSPVNAASRKCDTIYKGFAECLISLGDSMAQNVQQHREEDDMEEIEELDSICKSWDEFHKCASNVLVNCPEEAAAIWESLRQESRKIQYQGNLHDLCSARKANSMRGFDTGETNKETLRGSANLVRLGLLPGLLVLSLQWAIFQWA
ncbi:neuritin-like protein isoform 2-T2 [Discoglossus pictus]